VQLGLLECHVLLLGSTFQDQIVFLFKNRFPDVFAARTHLHCPKANPLHHTTTSDFVASSLPLLLLVVPLVLDHLW
jgi:hypothetical protein